ncbi:MAG: hypothetical protein ACWGQW_26285 [bacterium]
MTEETMGLIQGKHPGSLKEWYYAVALWKYKWTFDYQVGIMGGRRLKGGQVIDFIVHTRPLTTPVYIYGEYWHGGTRKERDTLLRITLKNYFRGLIRDPIVIEGKDLGDQEQADQMVLKLFGKAG